MMPSGGCMLRRPDPEDKRGQQDDGERPSESLRCMIDDLMSGKIETTDYPSSKEYLEHLDAVLDE